MTFSPRATAAIWCAIAAATIAAHPAFRLSNLFQHQLNPIESPLYYPANARGVNWTPFPDGPQANLRVVPPVPVIATATARGPFGPDHFEAAMLDGMRGGAVMLGLPDVGASFLTFRVDLTPLSNAVAEVRLTDMDTSETRRLLRTVHLRQGYVRLDPWMTPGHRYTLTIQAIGNAVILERMALFRIPKRNAPPPLDHIAMVLLLIAIVTATLASQDRVRQGIAVGGILAVATALQIAWDGQPFLAWAWFGAVVVAMAARTWNQSALPFGRPADWFWVVAALALMLRWSRLMGASIDPLEGDPLVFCTWASHLSDGHALVTGTREPFYVWVDWLTMHILGPNAFQTRAVSVLFSLMVVALTYRLVVIIADDRWAALAAMALMAVNVFAVFASIDPQRTQSFEALVMLFCVVIVGAGVWTGGRLAAGIAVAAALCLNWLIALTQIPTFFIGVVAGRRMPWRMALAVMAGAFVLLVPYFAASKARYGSPIAALTVHANYWHNVDRNGVYGYEKEGEKHSWTQFLFHDVGVPALIKKTALGYASLMVNPNDRMNRIYLGTSYWLKTVYWIFPFYLFGIVEDLRRRRWMVFWILVAFLNISPYFAKETISPRYVFYVAPCFAYWAGLGIAAALRGGACMKTFLWRTTR